MWGKAVGGITGFTLAGPVGALACVWLGHRWLDASADMAMDAELPEDTGADDAADAAHEPAAEVLPFAMFTDPAAAMPPRELALVEALAALAAKLAKCDGPVSAAEVGAFRTAFAVEGAWRPAAARAFNAAKRDAYSIDHAASRVAHLFDFDPDVLEEVLDALFTVARADGPLVRQELRTLRLVSHRFGIDDVSFNQAYLRFETARQDLDIEEDAYRILGMPEDADDATIREAHRRLVRAYHPDRLLASGMPVRYLAPAQEKLATFNAALDAIARERGWRGVGSGDYG
ncbi:MAG: TerB family tellurite resistance protein [Geminicoccaceae bacterium]